MLRFTVVTLLLIYSLNSTAQEEHAFHNHTLEEEKAIKTADSLKVLGILEQTKKNTPKDNNIPKAINCNTDNYDFENGSVSGWTATNNVQMMSGAGVDPYGGFPVVYPGGGGFSVKLGSDQTNYQGALSRTIAVPVSGQSILSFHFAICIFNYPHSAAEAAKFTVKFYDQNNNLLACPNYECFYSTDQGAVGVSTFQTTTNPASFYNPTAEGAGPSFYNVTWSDWTDVTIDLSAYAGQNVTAVFDNKYCIYTPDWCYAYVDVDCPSTSTQVFTVCQDIPGILSGPSISGTYKWYDINGNVIGNTQNLNITTPGLYTLGITPTGTACSAVQEILYDYNVNPNPVADFTFVENCAQQAATFTNTSSTSNSTIWDFGDGGNAVTQSPSHVYATDGVKNVKLVVTDVNGCTDSITKPINIYPLPVANFLLADNCLNVASNFTDQSNISSGSINSWNWNFGGGVTSTAQNPSNLYTTSGTKNIDLIVTSALGCKDTITQSLNVFALPVADFSNSIACVGQQTTFTDLSTVPAPEAINTWAWLFGDGQTSGAQNPNVVFNTTGNMSNQLIVTSANGCKDTVTKISVAANLPMPNFTFVENCADQIVTFTNTSSTTSSSTWDFGDGGTSILTSPTHIYNIDGIKNVKLIVSDAGGCTDSITKPISVFPLPTANFNLTNICFGLNSVFTDQSIVSSGNIASWNWNLGGANSTNQNPTFIYPSDGIKNITLIATTDKGCKDTITQSLTIFPKPNSDFSSTSVCVNNNTTFNDLSSINAPDNITNYQWTFGDGQTSALQNPTNLFASENIYNNTLIVTSNNGCKDTVVYSSEVWPLPVADFIQNSVCEQTQSVFVDNSTISSTNTPNNISIYAWDFGDGGTSANTNPTHSYASEGTYNVLLTTTSTHGCIDSQLYSTIVFDKPVANFTVAPVCFGNMSDFIDNSSVTAPETISNYSWTFGNAQTSSLQNPSLQFATDNIFNNTLIVTSANGCKDTVVVQNTVWPLPQVNFNVTEVCYGFTSSFVDASTISNNSTANNNISWDWDLGDGSIANGTNNTHDYVNDGTYPVTLTVVSNNNCVNSVTKNAIVNPKPNVSFSGINLTGCSPICPNVTSTSVINAPGILNTFNWVYSDGFTDNGNFTARCFDNTSDSTQTYGLDLYVTSDKGCKDSVKVGGYIEVYHLPHANFTFAPIAPDIFHNTVDFTNTSTAADSYNWTFGNGMSSTEVDPQVVYEEVPSVYNIVLVASTIHNCRDTAIAQIEIRDVVFYFVPNAFTPDNDEFNQSFKAVFGGDFDVYNFQMEIYNRWGELIFVSHDVEVGWDGTYKGLICKEGVYTWKITYKEKRVDKHREIHGHVNLLK